MKKKETSRLKKIGKRFLKISLICFALCFLLLTIIYVFRVSLLSNTICTQIAKVVEENTGIKIKISEFSGSYFFDVKIKKVTLLDGNGIVSELEIDEINAIYNPFALLSGGKIVNKIEIKTPRITIIKIPEVKKEEKEEEKNSPNNFDINFLLKQVPEINIKNVNIFYNIAKQKLKISSLTFINKNLQSELSIEKIFVENGDIKQTISDFSLKLGIKNNIFSISELKLVLNEYKEHIHWKNLLSLDLNNFEKLPISFTLPTPGGIVDGTIALASGKYIKVNKGEINFNKVMDIIYLLQKKEATAKNFPGKLAFDVRLAFPEWNPEKLQGVSRIDIYEKSPRIWKIEKKETEDLLTYFSIEDFAIIEKIAKEFITLDAVDASGNLALINSLALNKKNMRTHGKIAEGSISTKYFPKQTISGKWDIKYDLERNICDVPLVAFKLGDIEAKLKSYLDLGQKKQSSIDAYLNIPSLKKYLNMFLKEKDAYDGSIKFSIKANGVLPDLKNTKQVSRFDGEINCKLDNLFIQGQKLGSLSFNIKFILTNKNIKISKFTSFWNKKKIFQFSIDSGFKPHDSFSVKGRYRLKNVAQKLEAFVPKISEIFQGSIDGKLNIEGKIPGENSLDILVENRVTLKDGLLLDKLPYKSISSSLKLQAHSGYIDIKHIKANLEKENILFIFGKLGTGSNINSSITSSIKMTKPLQKLATILPSDMPSIHLGKFAFETKIWGKLSSIEKGESVYLKTNLQLDDVKIDMNDKAIKKTSFDTLRFNLETKANLKRVFLRSLDFHIDDNIAFKMNPSSIDLKKDLIVKLNGSMFLNNISQYISLPKVAINDISSNFATYIKWSSLNPGNFKKYQAKKHLLQQKPEVIWKYAQKNLMAKCTLDIKSSEGEINDVSYKNAAFQFKTSLNKGKINLDELGITLNKHKLLDCTGSFDLKKDLIAKLKGKVSIKNISQYVSLPKITIGDIDSNFATYVKWSSLDIGNFKKYRKKTHLLQQKPAIIWKLAKKNIVAKCRLAVKSTTGKIENISYENASFRFNTFLNKGKINLNEVMISLDEQKLLACAGSFDSSKNKIVLDANVAINKIENFLAPFDKNLSVTGDLKSSIFVSGKMPAKNISLNLNGHCKVSLENTSILQKIDFSSVAFNTKFTTKNDILNLSSSFLANKKELLNTIATITNTPKHIDADIKTELKIATVEQYLEKLANISLFKGDLSLKNHLNGRWLYEKKSLDFANIDLALDCSNGSIIDKPYKLISVRKNISLKNNIAQIKTLTFSLDKEKLLDVSGDVGLDPNKLSDIKGNIVIADIDVFMKRFLGKNPQKIKGKVDFGFGVKGALLAKNLQCNLESALQITNFSYEDKSLPAIKWETKLDANEDIFTVKKCDLYYGEVEVFDLSGNLGYKPGSAFDIVLKSEIGDLINYFAPILMDKKGSIFNGKSHVYLQAKGTIPSDDKSIDLSMEFKIPITTKEGNAYWEMNLGNASLWGNKKTAPHGLDSLIQVSGSQTHPVVKALFNFKQDLVRLPEANTRINDIYIEGVVREQKFTLSMKCLVGGGSLGCDLAVTFDETYFPQEISLDIKGERVLLIRDDMLYGRADLDVHLKGNIQKTNDGPMFKGKLDGVVDITEFKVTADMTVEALLQGSPERASTSEVGVSSPFLDLDLNLQIKISKVAIYSSLARIKMKGSIWVRGTAETPEISGWIGTTSGILFLPQGNMNITECIVRLSPNKPLIPQLNIVAEYQIREYQIFVTIKGTPGDMSIEFSSSPSLPKEDVLALLITGATRSELAQSGGGEQAQNLGSAILLQQILNAIGIGSFVSAQVTGTSAAVTIAPESWNGIGIQAKTEQSGTSALNFLYRIKFE